MKSHLDGGVDNAQTISIRGNRFEELYRTAQQIMRFALALSSFSNARLLASHRLVERTRCLLLCDIVRFKLAR